MGIPGMQTFGKNNNLFKQVNIVEEVKNYKKNNENKNALIIFDINGFIYSKCDGINGALGGEHLHLTNTFRTFFKGLIAAGADLVFFSDGLMQTDKTKWWCKKQDNCYNDYYGMLSYRTVVSDNLSSKQFKCPFLVQSIIQMIKKEKLGEVYITTGIECDRAIVKYAADNEALAIVSGDTDFLFFDGPFELWYHGLCLNFSKFTMHKFDREKLRSILNLNWDQMKIFATIAGNDITKPYLTYGRHRHMEIAELCRNLNIDSTNEILSYMGLKDETDKREIVLKSIEFYNIDGMEDLEKNNDFNALVHSFKHEIFFPYDVSFFSFVSKNTSSTRKLLIDYVKEVFQKLGGLLLQDDKGKKINILTKLSQSEDYKEHKLTPNFNYNGHRNKILWCLGLDDDIFHDLRDILDHKRRLLLPMLSILFLKKIGEMDIKQATAMLIAHYSEPSIINSISAVKSEIIRNAQIFLKICSLVRDCFQVCDLNELLVEVFEEDSQFIPGLKDFYLSGISVYDGLYYANLMQKEEFRRNSEDKYFDRRQVKRTLEKHMMNADGGFIDACCRLLMK